MQNHPERKWENESKLVDTIKQIKKRTKGEPLEQQFQEQDRKNQQAGEHNQRWFWESSEFQSCERNAKQRKEQFRRHCEIEQKHNHSRIPESVSGRKVKRIRRGTTKRFEHDESYDI